MMTLVAAILVLTVAAVLWNARRHLHLVQFRPVAPLAGSAATARIRPRQ